MKEIAAAFRTIFGDSDTVTTNPPLAFLHMYIVDMCIGGTIMVVAMIGSIIYILTP